MNKMTLMVLFIISFLTLFNNTSAQIHFYDSVNTVVSSPVYDYKNPVFKNTGSGYSSNTWLVYERHNGSVSDIVVRKSWYANYDAEIVITNNSNALNINPAISGSMIVWQSNAGGNWDLYYSINTGDNNWSDPVLLDSTLSDETYPCILNNNVAPVEYNYYYLSYIRNNSVRFKRYKTSTGIWDNDTLVAEGSYEYSRPVIGKGTTGSMLGVIYSGKSQSSHSKLFQRLFYEQTPISWNSEIEIYQPNSQNNLSSTFESREYATYSYDTLNTKHILGFYVNGQFSIDMVTMNVPGKHLYGKGSSMGIILNDGLYFFTTFNALSIRSDSLVFTFINRPSIFNTNPQYKYLYLGDTNLIPAFDVSSPLFYQSFYRIKTIWERKNGVRTELAESYMTDVLNDYSNNNSVIIGFYLAQNYPNPFNPATKIRYSLPENSYVVLKVFDALGKRVSTLINEDQNAGEYSVEFKAENLPSGVYYYKIEVNGISEIRKMLLIR